MTKLKHTKSLYDNHVVMMIRNVWSAVCDGISCTITVCTFVETANVPDLVEVSKLHCYSLLFFYVSDWHTRHKCIGEF